MQSIFKKWGLYFNPYVFVSSFLLIAGFLGLGIYFTRETSDFFGVVQDFIATNMGWHYIQTVGFLLIFTIWLYFSPYGDIRLGAKNEKPEFSRKAWFSMLFSAGMGIGLIFYSVAEPMMHHMNPPVIGHAVEPGTIDSAQRGMLVTFFHWGLHAWAIYIVMGLTLAYFCHRKGMPLSVRSAFYPLIGNRIYGRTGDLIDTFSVLGTMFGIATSLGLGVMQVNAGLNFMGWMDISVTNQVILIACITLVATLSVTSGLGRGIKWLSMSNLAIGFVLLLFVFLAGPTLFLLKSFVQSSGDYMQNLVSLTFWTSAYRGNDWQKSWTLFYWAWWISWSPFVGVFIARISRGRKIKEFVLGVLLAPSILTFFWLTVFGNTAIHQQLFQNTAAGLVEAIGHTETVPKALYLMLEQLPLSKLMSFLATIVIISYFVTSSDSGSLVIDILTAGGSTEPPVIQRIFWALLEGVVASILLITGGLIALQTAAITTALPLSLILLLCCWGLVKSLRKELKLIQEDEED